MKKSDMAAIVLIAGFATIIAFVMANIFLGDPSEEVVNVEYLDVISSEIAQPDEEVFNSLAINPTVETIIGACRENERWDDVLGKCVSNETPAAPEGEETGTESGGDTENGSGDEQNAPEE